MTKDVEVELHVTDLGRAKVAVDGTFCTVPAGSRIAKVAEGLVVCAPDSPPYLVRWDGVREELKVTKDGAIVLPPVPGLDEMSINMTLVSLFESVGGDAGKWLTREQQIINDLREAVKPSAVNEVSVKRTAELVALCRRALDVLEDVT